MTDDTLGPDDAAEPETEDSDSGHPDLDNFAALQRHVAGSDFSAIQSAYSTAAAAAAAHSAATAAAMKPILDMQAGIAKSYAQSMDFSRLTQVHAELSKRIGDATATNASAVARAVSADWAATLSKSIRLPAIQQANAALGASATRALFESNSALVASAYPDLSKLIPKITLPTVDFARIFAEFDRWLPANLRHNADLDGVAALALVEGLPLAWIPRSEIVGELLGAEDSGARLAHLELRKNDILDDCEQALAAFDDQLARECLDSVRALRAGLVGPAQSHAANIIDSLLRHIHGESPGITASKVATDGFDELRLQVAAENIVLRPLLRAFVGWRPDSNMPVPDHFARHTTVHAAGHGGVFASTHALVAVMLATSLAVQYLPPVTLVEHHEIE